MKERFKLRLEKIRINRERMIAEFTRLAGIASPSRRERGVADYLTGKLKGLGLQVSEDRCGEKVGGNCGNLLAVLPGDDSLPALFFSAHMDTVEPADGVQVLLENGVFHSKGKTILGGDDKAGITVMLELIQLLHEHERPHGRLEFLFTIGEEQGLWGSRYFDIGQLQARMGFVLDTGVAPGTFVIAAPFKNMLSITVRGRAAHAGIDPERGINAIKVAGTALAKSRLGRIDAETMANIGIIKGGKATNIIPDVVYLEGETRSITREKMDQITRELAATFDSVCREKGTSCDSQVKLAYEGFRLDPQLPVVRLVARAAEEAGFRANPITTGGGSDANNFNSAGIPTVNLAIGMDKAHTVDEVLAVDHLVGSARWVWELVNLVGRGVSAS